MNAVAGTVPARSGRSMQMALVCGGLLLVFAALAWSAVIRKSPTYDEPYHAPAAWTHLRYGDFRIDCEDPPLWKYWAALPNGRNALKADFNSPMWTDEPRQLWLQWQWCVKTLYDTPGNDAEGFIARSRMMMLVMGVALGGLIGWWAWRVGGAVGAIVATGLFALDPNFLAHAPLVKNDVVFSLAMLALVYVLWRAGERLTVARAVSIGCLCGVMLTVKFSGVLAGVIVPLLLGVRALMPATWWAFGRERSSRVQKVLAAAGASLLAAVMGVTIIWAVYGFRFSPTPDPAVRLNTEQIAHMALVKEVAVQHGGAKASPEDVAAEKPSGFLRAVQYAEAHHLLPQAWLAGLLFTYQSSLIRMAFLCGELSPVGWWYYFPFAMLVKTPLATLAAMALAITVLLVAIRAGALRSAKSRWAAFCLAVPFAIYMTSAMRSNLNIGLRHVLPVYPLLFIAIGGAASFAWNHWRRKTRFVLVGLAALLCLETLCVFPDYLPFFNVAAGGSTGGLHLLGDSNLDWGQDLKLLAAWQKEHPQKKLYLSYFGLAAPAYYSIDYIPLRGGYTYAANPTLPDSPGVIAVSATNLQGILMDDENLVRGFYKPLSEQPPLEVLGGSIYLYEWPPHAPSSPGAGER